MKIAIVLYGQPRDYEKGYKNIMSFVSSQPNCEFDFFYHCWTLNPGEEFAAARWRHIEKNTLKYDPSTAEELYNMYHPVAYEYEQQTGTLIDSSGYMDTLAFKRTTGEKARNSRNVIFQMYSRNKARNLLAAHVRTSGVVYDFVLTTRFDITTMPRVVLSQLDTTKTYVSDIHVPRKIIPDNCIITPMRRFMQWFAIYESIPVFLNDSNLEYAMRAIGERLEINAEEVILAKYLYDFKNVNDIGYFKGGTI